MREVRARERAKYDAKYFAAHYWREDLPGKTGNRGRSYDDPSHEARFQFLGDVLAATLRFRSVLDVGCATGGVLRALGAHSLCAVGCDASRYAVRQAVRERVTGVCCASAECLPYPDLSFDLVICIDVLEHLPVFDVEVAVRELCRVARQHVVASINLDNPYEFHPSVLSRESWEALFALSNTVKHDAELEGRIQRMVRTRYEEYEFFVFRRCA